MLTDARLGYPPAAQFPGADADDFWQHVSQWPLGVPKRCADVESVEMSASQSTVWIGGHRFTFYAVAINAAAGDCAQRIRANRDFETGDHAVQCGTLPASVNATVVTVLAAHDVKTGLTYRRLADLARLDRTGQWYV